MRALFFTAWSTKRGTALPMQKKFLLVSVSVRFPHYLDVFLKPAGVAMSRKVAAKAHG